MRYLSGISDIVDDYDGFVLDLFGVTHDGKTPYPGVLECLKKLKEKGKKIIFLSNAPRRSWVVKDRISGMGITSSFYDEVISSGEETYENLKSSNDPFYQSLGRKCYHIGTEKDASLFEGQDLERVSRIEDADFILVSDLPKAEDSPEDFKDVLMQALKYNLPMVCANPDHIVHIVGKAQYCAGALAALYEEMGGRVKYHGKPYPSIYDFVRDHFPKGSKLLAVGDSFLTDVAGAHNAHMDVAFVGGGIHAEDLNVKYGELPGESEMEKLCVENELYPTYVLPGLTW